MSLPQISIVIPVYNSSGILPELLSRIDSALTGKLAYEVILVDDASADASWETINGLSGNYPLSALRLRKNSGQDNALMAGFAHAKGGFVVVMDDDLQHDPLDIPRLYEVCKNGADVCYAHFREKEQSLFKNAGSALNGKMAGFLLNKPANLYLSPFKMIRHSLIREILNFQGPFPYVDGIILTLTANIGEIESTHHPRHSGKGNYSLGKSADVFLNLMTGYSVKPLRLLMVLGLFTLLAGFGLGVAYLVEYFTDEKHVHGWITLVVLLLFFGGFTLFGIGLLGEYLARIYLISNRRPPYSIAEIIRKKGDES